MNEETREFHIGDIISVFSGNVASPGGIDEVQRLLNWMTADDLVGYQMVRAREECLPLLHSLFPELASITVPDFIGDKSDYPKWIHDLEQRHGATRHVPRLAPEDHTVIDPDIELQFMKQRYGTATEEGR